jgi:predicted LPLAT superfamily acyltransferase
VTGASLLPVFTIQKEICHFEVVMGNPLLVEKRGSKQESLEVVIRQYAAVLEGYVARYPDLWYGWHTVSDPTPTNA